MGWNSYPFPVRDLLELFSNNAWSPEPEKPRSSPPADNLAKKVPVSRAQLSPKLAASAVDNLEPVFEWDLQGADGQPTTFRGTAADAGVRLSGC